MKLIEQMREDRKVAYKSKENIRRDLLGCLIGDSTKDCVIDNTTGKKVDPSDDIVLKVIKKFVDGANEIMSLVKETEYEYYKASMEIDILNTYRPRQLDEPEIRALIVSIKEDIPEVKLGDVMKYFKESYSGQYDGALVSKCTKEILNG